MKKKRKKRKYRNGQTRLMTPPPKYQENFLNRMDFRTEIFHNLDKEYKQTIRDLGGDLSQMELSLVERLVFCNYLIRNVEVEMSNSGNGSQAEFLDRWIKLNHSIQSIVAKLGCQKRQTGSSKLQEHLAEKYEE